MSDPAFKSRYWQATFDTDWAAASPMTWHTFTLELAEAVGFGDTFFARLAKEARSKVTSDIEETGDGVKRTDPGRTPAGRRRPPKHQRRLADRLVQGQ